MIAVNRAGISLRADRALLATTLYLGLPNALPARAISLSGLSKMLAAPARQVPLLASNRLRRAQGGPRPLSSSGRGPSAQTDATTDVCLEPRPSVMPSNLGLGNDDKHTCSGD